jgi:hypothetical protein
MGEVSGEAMSILYVIVDEKLSKAHHAPQAAHGVAQFFIESHAKAQKWGNGTLVLLKGDVQTIAQETRIPPHAIWREPDLGNRITALAFWEPLDQRTFDGYELL